jgi:hypothetical protein
LFLVQKLRERRVEMAKPKFDRDHASKFLIDAETI